MILFRTRSAEWVPTHESNGFACSPKLPQKLIIPGENGVAPASLWGKWRIRGHNFAERVTMSIPRQTDDDGGDAKSGSDHVLLKRFREGEQDAATALYLRYSQRLQALARAKTSPTLATRFDPEDIVQSVFRTFFRRVSGGLYDVPAGDELWQLLLVIALNKIRDLAVFHRAQKRDVTKTESESDMTIAAAGQPQTDSMEVLKVVLDDFLAQLPASHAAVARMRMEGYQVDEIATKTKRSKRTVERVLNDLRKHLVDKMGME
jgi:RNA polymerase sigma-70 factor (ECF subfamily)